MTDKIAAARPAFEARRKARAKTMPQPESMAACLASTLMVCDQSTERNITLADALNRQIRD